MNRASFIAHILRFSRCEGQMRIHSKIPVWLFGVCILISTALAQTTPDIDFDGNDVIDFGDFVLLAQAFGTGDAQFDLNGDGAVDLQDFLIFARLYDRAQVTVRHSHVDEDVAVGSVDVFSVRTLGSQPRDIVVDVLGRVWFAETGANQIGRFDPSTETFVEYPLPTPGGQPTRLAVDGRGVVWFTDIVANAIGRLDPISEEVRMYSVPTPGSRPSGLVFDRKGYLWFTQESGNQIGRLDPDRGTFEEYPVFTSSAGLDEILIDSEGILVFSERAVGKFGRMNPETKEIVEIEIPIQDLTIKQFVLDDGDQIWFAANSYQLHMWDLLATGNFASYILPEDGPDPSSLSVDLNGRIWYAADQSRYFARFDPEASSIRILELPFAVSGVGRLTVDRLGKIWFTDPSGNRIGSVEDIGP